jgi:hypothetical protein
MIADPLQRFMRLAFYITVLTLFETIIVVISEYFSSCCRKRKEYCGNEDEKLCDCGIATPDSL